MRRVGIVIGLLAALLSPWGATAPARASGPPASGGTPDSVKTAAQAGRTHPALPGTRALGPLLSQASALGEPVVVMFSRVGCVWCEALRREQLSPLAKTAGERHIRVVEVDVDDRREFLPGSASKAGPGAAASGADLAGRLKVRLTPTVVFLGPRGELADRLVGYPSRDFYGAYLDERIEQARTALRGPKPAAQ